MTQYTFFQGMDGDRAAPAGGTKTVNVTGTSVTDSLWLAGRVYQARNPDGAGGTTMSTTITTPWASAIGSSNGYQTSRKVRDGTVQLTVPVSTGGNRVTSTVTTYDATYGLPLTVSAINEIGTVSTCTTTQYTPANTTAWIIGARQQVLVVGKKCADLGTAVYPADHISGIRYLYDTLTYGTTPTKGNVTETRFVTAYTGSTPTWTTQSNATYDTMGRPLTSTDALGRVTSTAYTPSASAPAGSGPLLSTVVTNPAPFLWTTTTQFEPTRGQVISVTDANGKVITGSYDALGRTWKVWGSDRPAATYPTSPSVSYAYSLSTTVPRRLPHRESVHPPLSPRTPSLMDSADLFKLNRLPRGRVP